MKMEFCSKVKKLTPDGLIKLVQIVQQAQSSSMNELEFERVQIRVDDWSRQVFDLISNQVDEILAGPNKRQKFD